MAEFARGPDIGERDRLASARVVRDCKKYHRHVCRSLRQQQLKSRQINVPLEGMGGGGVVALGDNHVAGFGT